MVKKRGRPKAICPLIAVSCRLDADLLAYYRKTGRGWMTRIRNDLRSIAICQGMNPALIKTDTVPL